MSALIFVRDERTLPYFPVTVAALDAIDATVPPRRRAYARSLYLALLQAANANRGDRAAASRSHLAKMAGCSVDLVSDLRPLLEAAGVVRVVERQHAGAQIEHEWIVVEPPAEPVAEVRGVLAASQDPPGHEPRHYIEEQLEGEGDARTRSSVDHVDERLASTVAILRSCPRFTFDPDHVAVANCLAAHPGFDHEKAARLAVVRGTDPNYRTTDGARALWFAFDALARARSSPLALADAGREARAEHQLKATAATGWGAKYDQACGLAS